MPAEADPSSEDWLATRTRYRRLGIGSMLGGIAVSMVVYAVGPPLVAVAVFWLGIVGFFAVRRAAPMTLFDERDRALERRASYDTIRVVGAAFFIGAPMVKVGGLTVPPVVDGALVGIEATVYVFVLAYIARRYA